MLYLDCTQSLHVVLHELVVTGKAIACSMTEHGRGGGRKIFFSTQYGLINANI